MRPRQHRDDPQGSPPPAPAAFDRQGLLFTESSFSTPSTRTTRSAPCRARGSRTGGRCVDVSDARRADRPRTARLPPPPAPAAFDRQGLLFTEFFFHSIDENDEKRAVSGARKSDWRSLRRRERRPASRSPTHGSPAAPARASSVRPSGSASHEFFSAPSTTSTGRGRGERAAHDGRPAMGRPGRQLVAGVVWRGGRRCLPANQQITNEPNEPRTRYPHQAPPRDVRGPSSHGTHAHRAGPTRTRPRRELKLI